MIEHFKLMMNFHFFLLSLALSIIRILTELKEGCQLCPDVCTHSHWSHREGQEIHKWTLTTHAGDMGPKGWLTQPA